MRDQPSVVERGAGRDDQGPSRQRNDENSDARSSMPPVPVGGGSPSAALTGRVSAERAGSRLHRFQMRVPGVPPNIDRVRRARRPDALTAGHRISSTSSGHTDSVGARRNKRIGWRFSLPWLNPHPPAVGNVPGEPAQTSTRLTRGAGSVRLRPEIRRRNSPPSRRCPRYRASTNGTISRALCAN